jgi:hydroxymethylglutaryl-CoA reductase
LSLAQRVSAVADWAGLDEKDKAVLLGRGLAPEQADLMIENSIGVLGMPLGVAANFLINGRDYLVPMAVEESSVVAGASLAAKLVRQGGGFHTTSDEPVMIGQMQVIGIADMEAASRTLAAQKAQLLAAADRAQPSFVRRGGGARDIEIRALPETPAGPMLVMHLLYDTRDAMGANVINTVTEALAPIVEELTGGQAIMSILSNLTDRRLASARCTLPVNSLETGALAGEEVARRIAAASALAYADPYRAATHNKGIMNGVDAVCLATGNDWRAVEAGAHAYAARDGQYRGLSTWSVNEAGELAGEMTLPLAVGIVGGATRVNPTAKAAMKILAVTSAAELSEVIAAVGLAQNLAALRAMVTTGIQGGHMRLHARQVAMAAGATGNNVAEIAAQMAAEKNIRVERAAALLLERNRTA